MRAVDGRQSPLTHERFDAGTREHPDATALVLDDRHVTYGELNRRAGDLARRLRAIGIGPEVAVGVCLPRSIDAVVCLLGILKAGGTYVPIDADYPPDRIAFMADDARVAVLLTGVSVPEAERIERAVPLAASPGNAAYVIYTSGSTGKPKGVVVSHEVAARHFEATRRRFEISRHDRVLQFASSSFDVSLEQVWTTLLAGACVVMRGPEQWTALDLLAHIRDQMLTVVNLPTAYWHQVSRELLAASGRHDCDSLRLLIVGGDRLLPESVRLWHATPMTRIALLNAYGPTEAAITATACDVTAEYGASAGLTRIPIGAPLEERLTYIVGDGGALAAAETTGELCIGGPLLARGYLDRPALTAERFVPDPFGGQPGARMYRTGDVAAVLADGNIDFVGRRDHQVKVRGFRVELGEIEAVLASHPAVRDTVVVAYEHLAGAPAIVAYVVAARDAAIDARELRRFVQGHLPDYLVPSAVMFLDALPLTPGGKVDKHALPPLQRHESAATAYAAARTPIEEYLCEMWAGVLGVSRLGIHDNLFDYGCHSLLVIRGLARVETTFKVELPVRTVFEAATVSALAREIDDRLAAVRRS